MSQSHSIFLGLGHFCCCFFPASADRNKKQRDVILRQLHNQKINSGSRARNVRIRSASSSQALPGHPPEFAFDGNNSTCFQTTKDPTTSLLVTFSRTTVVSYEIAVEGKVCPWRRFYSAGLLGCMITDTSQIRHELDKALVTWYPDSTSNDNTSSDNTSSDNTSSDITSSDITSRCACAHDVRQYIYMWF